MVRPPFMLFACVVAAALFGEGHAQDCTATNARCAGAEGFPFVQFTPCCSDGDECIENSALGWGKWCVPKDGNGDGNANNNCYANGQRCQGAPGFPAVEWKPCCDGNAQCVDNAALGWGKWCQTENDNNNQPDDTCYNVNERCQGAPGFPFVQFKPCCDADATCEDNEALGWGKWCTSPNSGGQDPDPTCYNEGERCQGAPGFPFVEFKPCCDGNGECVDNEALGWGKWCTVSGGGNGDNEYFLSDLPLFVQDSGYGDLERDRSTGEELPDDGEPITINGQGFQKGLGVHSTSVVIVALQQKCSTFITFMGIDDETTGPKAIPGGPYGSVQFEILVDGVSQYKSNNVFAQQPALFSGEISVAGAEELMLIVSDAGDGFTKDHADWADAKLVCSSAPTNDYSKLYASRGRWEGTMQWPVKSIHASLIPSPTNPLGVIISHASLMIGQIGSNEVDFPHDLTKVDFSEVGAFNHRWVDRQGEEMYCSGHVVHNGGVLEFGGHGGQINWVYIGKDQTSRFDISTDGWTVLQPMAQPRWYPTALTLGNGEVLSIAGSHSGPEGNNYRPEVYNPATNTWRTLWNVDYSGLLVTPDKEIILDDTYPFCVLATDGRVLWAGWDKSMAFIDTNGNGQWGPRQDRENFQRAWASPLLIRPDELLLVGGLDTQLNDAKAFNSVVRLSFPGGAQPTVSYAKPMTFPRVDGQATILPDGTAFINGGGNEHILGASPTHITAGEIFDPRNGESWTITAAAENPRGYHSTALLLPDGRVWTAGGECSPQPDGADNCPSGKTAEIFTPPYLFNADGGFADRPVIDEVPEVATRPTMLLKSSSFVSRITLVRVGSATHHMNFDQRFIELDWQWGGPNNSNEYTITVPGNPNLIPPGHYLLSILDDSDVPSESKFVLF